MEDFIEIILRKIFSTTEFKFLKILMENGELDARQLSRKLSLTRKQAQNIAREWSNLGLINIKMAGKKQLYSLKEGALKELREKLVSYLQIALEKYLTTEKGKPTPLTVKQYDKIVRDFKMAQKLLLSSQLKPEEVQRRLEELGKMPKIPSGCPNYRGKYIEFVLKGIWNCRHLDGEKCTKPASGQVLGDLKDDEIIYYCKEYELMKSYAEDAEWKEKMMEILRYDDSFRG